MNRIILSITLLLLSAASIAQDKNVRFGLGLGGSSLNMWSPSLSYDPDIGVSFHGTYQVANKKVTSDVTFEYLVNPLDIREQWTGEVSNVRRTSIQNLNLRVGVGYRLFTAENYLLDASGAAVGGWMYDYNWAGDVNDGFMTNRYTQELEGGPTLGFDLGFKNYFYITDVSQLIVRMSYGLQFTESRVSQTLNQQVVYDEEHDFHLTTLNLSITYALVL